MKIQCACGATIVDQSDQLPHKAHFIADEDWDALLTAIDDAIEHTTVTAKAREAACMRIRELMAEKVRMAWQCAACGRIYIDDRSYVAREFVPASAEPSREIFRSATREE